MVRSRKPFTSKERASSGFLSLVSHFPPPVQQQRGRRRKKRAVVTDFLATLAGGPEEDPPEDVQPIPTIAARTKKGRRSARRAAGKRKDPPSEVCIDDEPHPHVIKKPRIQWSAPERAKALAAAVLEWDERGPATLRDDGTNMSLAHFAQAKGISEHLFQKYAHTDKKKRRTIGKASHRPTVVTTENSEFIRDIAIRADRANNGLTRQETISHIQELEPNLSRSQVTNHYQRTFFTHHKGKLKKRPVTAQRTTTKRIAITVAQQYHWFKRYEEGLKFLREKNTGVCRKTGKQFGS